jgi:RNA polymerase sigma factor (sigma-70 family)
MVRLEGRERWSDRELIAAIAERDGDAIAGRAGTNVVDLVAGLPADERHAIEARVVHERSYSDIAAQLHCSEMVVRKRVSRGLGQVRRRLEGGR